MSEFPYNTRGILKKVMRSSERHSDLCSQEIVTLRAELAKRTEELQVLRSRVRNVVVDK